MRTVPELVREWCLLVGWPLPDGNGRSRVLREAGLLSQRGHGRGAAKATIRDAATFLIGCLVSDGVKDASERTAHACRLELFDPDAVMPEDFRSMTFLDAVVHCIENGRREDWAFKPYKIEVTRSDTDPVAFITLELRTDPGKVQPLMFHDPADKTGDRLQMFVIKAEMRGEALAAMHHLLNTPETAAPAAAATGRAQDIHFALDLQGGNPEHPDTSSNPDHGHRSEPSQSDSGKVEDPNADFPPIEEKPRERRRSD